MPFTTTPLADDDLDALLGGAATRLGSVAAGLSVGPAPAPASSAGPRLAAVAAVGLAAAGVAGVLAVSRGGDGAAPLPPGFAEGRYGTEVPIAEVDDGDGNPDTVLLRISPRTEVGTVTIRRNGAAEASTATTFGGGTPVSLPPAEVCAESPGAGGACGTAAQMAEPQVHVGNRSNDGTVLVTGVPDDAVAVTLDAGSARHWQRPVDGVALFPFDADASPDVVVEFVRADGTAAARATGRDDSLTDTELAARAVTSPSGRRLPSVWWASPTGRTTGGQGWWRREGRSTATSFSGPFSLQGFIASDGVTNADLYLMNVLTDQAAEARDRLALATDGAVRRAVDQPDGSTVLVWAQPSVADDRIDEVVATLVSSTPTAEVIDMSSPFAWYRGQTAQPYATFAVEATMFAVPVGSIDVEGRKRQVWATADDLGSVRFATLPDPVDGKVFENTTTTPTGPFAVPKVGERIDAGQVVLVPAATTSLRITFDGGTVLAAPLLDVRPTADAKLAVVPAGGTVRSVEAS